MSESNSTKTKGRPRKIRRRLRVTYNSNINESHTSKLDQEISIILKKKLELDIIIKQIQKNKEKIIKKEYEVFVERLHTLPRELLSHIFLFTASCPHASKKEIVSIFNQREKLRKQWDHWEQLPIPRQPHFSSFELDNEYITTHPWDDIYARDILIHSIADPCTISHIPLSSRYSGNIIMGRVKIFLPYYEDTRVDDVNTLRRHSINRNTILECEHINLDKYFSKTEWRGNNETGTHKNRQKHKSQNWVWGWGPLRVDNIDTRFHGKIAISFFEQLWFPSRRSLFNELTFIYSYGTNLDVLMQILKGDGVDISNCRTRGQCYRKYLNV